MVRSPLTGHCSKSPGLSPGPQQAAGLLVVYAHCARRTPRSRLGPECNTRFHSGKSSRASLSRLARLDRSYGCTLESGVAVSELGAWETLEGSFRQTARREESG